MGLFSYFSKEASLERKRQSAKKRLTNMYVQSQDRMAAASEMASFAVDGDEEAYRIFLSRFNLLNPSQVTDLQEKEDMLGIMVSIGEPLVEWTKKYVRETADGIHWPMRFLSRVLDGDAFRDFLADMVDATEAGYARDPKKKLVLVQLVGEHPNDRSRDAVAKFLDDHDEQVRFHTVDVLLRVECPGAQVALCERWANDEESSGRIHHAIAEAFAERDWSVDVSKLDVLRGRCPMAFRIGDDGRVMR